MSLISSLYEKIDFLIVGLGRVRGVKILNGGGGSNVKIISSNFAGVLFSPGVTSG